MTILNNYLRSADPIIKSAANLTINAMSAFQSNQITASEYSEIMENILDLDKVKELTTDMDRENEIVHAFEQIKEIAGMLSAL
jgi:hypothetical protein